MNRVALDRESTFLFADPFSWSESAAPEEMWLGGTLSGPYKGRGIENVRLLLEGKDKVLLPNWRIHGSGRLTWGMRSHCNHCELITSEYLIAVR